MTCSRWPMLKPPRPPRATDNKRHSSHSLPHGSTPAQTWGSVTGIIETAPGDDALLPVATRATPAFTGTTTNARCFCSGRKRRRQRGAFSLYLLALMKPTLWNSEAFSAQTSTEREDKLFNAPE